MSEYMILRQMKNLNEIIEEYSSKNKSVTGARFADKELLAEIRVEFDKLVQQSIVLLPPELSGKYCSNCGKKLSKR